MPTGITLNSTKVGLKQFYALNSNLNSAIFAEGNKDSSSSESCLERD